MQKQEFGGKTAAAAIGSGIVGAVAALGGVAIGWGAYSTLGVDHQLPLEPAIVAEQRWFRSTTAGEISYYVAREAAGRPLVLIHSRVAS